MYHMYSATLNKTYYAYSFTMNKEFNILTDVNFEIQMLENLIMTQLRRYRESPWETTIRNLQVYVCSGCLLA